MSARALGAGLRHRVKVAGTHVASSTWRRLLASVWTQRGHGWQLSVFLVQIKQTLGAIVFYKLSKHSENQHQIIAARESTHLGFCKPLATT